jgi:hypothetical protein
MKKERKLKELIKFKDLMKLLMGFKDSIKDSIEINFDHFIKIGRLGTQLKLWKAKPVQLVI